jgi:hypothetical protein
LLHGVVALRQNPDAGVGQQPPRRLWRGHGFVSHHRHSNAGEASDSPAGFCGPAAALEQFQNNRRDRRCRGIAGERWPSFSKDERSIRPIGRRENRVGSMAVSRPPV